MAIRRWLPTAVVLVAGAALAVALFLPTPMRGRIGGGAAYVFATYAQALSIFGLGMAVALLRRGPGVAGVLLFSVGIVAGLAAKDRMLTLLVRNPDAFELTAYIGPVSCILSGIALALPDRARSLAAPAVAALAGVATGFLAALNDPTFGESRFAAGAAAAAFWLLLAPLAFVPWLDAAHVRIGGRIVASWLVAIGLMLGAAKVYQPRPAPPLAPAVAPPPAAFGVPEKPKFDPRPAPAPKPPPGENDIRRP